MTNPHERLFYEVWADESHSRLVRVVAEFQPYTVKMQEEDFGHAVESVHITLVTKQLSEEAAHQYDEARSATEPKDVKK